MNKNKKTKKVLEIPKYIKYWGNFLQFFSKKWAAEFALDLFDRPIKFPMPEREKKMDRLSKQYPMLLPQTEKEITVYQWGEGTKKALLIHGWNGRGTQMSSLANTLVNNGYTVISFDAPGHGKSKPSRAMMTDFIEAAHQLNHSHGTFDIVIGHSLGGMSTINALSRGLSANKAVIIGSGDVIQDIIDDFVLQLGLKKDIGPLVKDLFEKKYNYVVEDYTVYKQAALLHIPVLVIHDKNDKDVPYTASENISKHLIHGELLITKKLGHRKILGDEYVINKIITFSRAH